MDCFRRRGRATAARYLGSLVAGTGMPRRRGSNWYSCPPYQTSARRMRRKEIVLQNCPFLNARQKVRPGPLPFLLQPPPCHCSYPPHCSCVRSVASTVGRHFPCQTSRSSTQNRSSPQRRRTIALAAENGAGHIRGKPEAYSAVDSAGKDLLKEKWGILARKC